MNRYFCIFVCGQLLEASLKHFRLFVSVCTFFLPSFFYVISSLDRYSTMTCGAASSLNCYGDCPECPSVQSVCCFGITDSGSLHIFRLNSGVIALEHIIPSMQTVSSGVSSALEMILASSMEV